MKKQYTVWDETPLRFYRFLCVWLPISFILGTFNLVAFFSEYTRIPFYYADPLFWIDVTFRLAIFCTHAVAVISLPKRLWAGPIGFQVNQIIFVIYEMIVRSLTGTTSTLATILGCALGGILMFVPVHVYFKKRRLLFSPAPNLAKKQITPAIPKSYYEAQETASGTFVVDTNTGEVIYERPRSTAQEDPAPSQSHESETTIPSSPNTQTEPIKEAKSKLFKKLRLASTGERLAKSIILELIFPVLLVSVVLLVIQNISLEKELDTAHISIEELEKSVSDLQADIGNLQTKYDILSDDYETITEENDLLNSKLEDSDYWLELSSKYAIDAFFMYENIGFISNDGSKVYHSYDCTLFQSSTASYWAHNIEYCEHLGYNPCILCMVD